MLSWGRGGGTRWGKTSLWSQGQPQASVRGVIEVCVGAARVKKMEYVNFSPTSVLSGLYLTIQSLLCLFVPEASKYLILTPANLLLTNNFIWIMVTCSFVEMSVVRYVFDVLILAIISRGLKGQPFDQFGLYFILNLVSCSFGTLLWLFYRFYLSNSEIYLIENVYGFGGVLMGLMMVARQQLKSTPVLPQYPPITFQYLPTLVLSLFTLLWIVGVHSLAKDISFLWISYFFSWTYLRFFFKYSVSPPLRSAPPLPVISILDELHSSSVTFPLPVIIE
jgi:hypothetical protein